MKTGNKKSRRKERAGETAAEQTRGLRLVTARDGPTSEPTINPADQLFQSLDLLLDSRLCEGVVILKRTCGLG